MATTEHDERILRHYFMRFCNFRRFGGNFAGQINSIIGKLWLYYPPKGVFMLCLIRNGSCAVWNHPGTALASGRFFGYDSRVA
jgi:hypothetical protein